MDKIGTEGTMQPVNEYWLWTERADWVLHTRSLSRAELDALERRWQAEGWVRA